MKTVEITDTSPADFGRRETWLVTRRGKPVAAVVPIRPGMDAETFSLSHNPEFIELINRSWRSYEEHGAIPHGEMLREFGLPEKPARRRRLKAR